MSHANLSTVHDAGQAGGEGGRPWRPARWAAAMRRNGLHRSATISPIQRRLTSLATAAIAAMIMAPSLMVSRNSSSRRSALVATSAYIWASANA